MSFALLVLGSYRVTRLLNRDSITRPLWRRTPSWLASGWFCPWCLGFWVSLGLVLAVRQTVNVEVAVEVLAVSTGVGFAALFEDLLEEAGHG